MAKRHKIKPTNNSGKRGMPPFVPSAEQRAWVGHMVGMRMTWDEIASLIINPRTDAPISKETLGKAFAMELAAGKQKLKALVNEGYLDRLKAKDWNAITFGLRHFGGFRDHDPSVVVSTAESNGNPASMIEVRFVKARERSDDDEE